jgi:hypothetical protein
MKKNIAVAVRLIRQYVNYFCLKGKKNNFRRIMYSYAHTDNVLFNMNTKKSTFYLD